MKKFLLIVVSLTIAINAFSQTESIKSKKDKDPLDISQELKKIAEYGVPTITLVDLMKAKADTLYNSKSWSEAIDAYDEFSKKANWLANLLSICVEPYYSASYRDQENVSRRTLEKWIPYENASNKYKRLRNQAYVRIGLCYKNLGNIDKAVAYLYKGLDFVSLDSSDDWSQAAEALSDILEFHPEKK